MRPLSGIKHFCVSAPSSTVGYVVNEYINNFPNCPINNFAISLVLFKLYTVFSLTLYMLLAAIDCNCRHNCSCGFSNAPPTLDRWRITVHCHMTSSGLSIDGRKLKKVFRCLLNAVVNRMIFSSAERRARCDVQRQRTLCHRSFVLPASRWDCRCVTIVMMAAMDHWQKVSAGRWCSLALDQRTT